MKVVISDCSWNAYDVEKKTLPADAEVVCTQVKSEDDILNICKDADAVMSEYGPYTRRVLEKLPKLKIIANSAMGVDNVDLVAAKELGIAVTNVPDYCFYEVAEHAMALIIASLRNIVGYNEKVHEKIWDFAQSPKLYRINGITLGMIGCGRIPQKVAVMAKGFGMNIVGYDPYLPKEVADKFHIKLVSMEELAAQSNVVLSHVPLMPATVKMVDSKFFKALKKSPIFVNTSRGGTVDYEALCEALKDGRVSRAALDVVDSEPADFNSDIFKLDNVIFTPHAAFYSETALEEVRRRSAENICHFFKGEDDKITYVVNPKKK